MNEEAKRVKERYSRRLKIGTDERYNLLQPDVLLRVQHRQRELVNLLKSHLNTPLSEAKALEIGCGSGLNLLEFIRLGFTASNLSGNELLEERVEIARSNLPSACTLISGDANKLNITKESLDIVYQSVVFSSLLDDSFQEELADNMWEWVKPGGGVLWYDFTYNNPNNKDVRGVPLARAKQLFPKGEIHTRRVTLAPPISRRVTKIHPILYNVFNAFPFLRTHVLCYIKKP